ESARVAAIRGHEVVLVEKTDKLGGNLIPGGVPSFKRYNLRLIEWYKRQLELLEVDVRLETCVTKENIADYQADEIIVATGSTPIILQQPGFEAVITADDVLMGRKKVGDQIVIIGGGLVGCETGLWLAQQGKKVTIIEMLPEILGGPHNMPFMNYQMLTELLQYHHVKIYTNTKIKEVHSNEVVLTKDEEIFAIPADTVISAIGYKENDHLYNELRELEIPVHNIGDSNKVHNIMYAIWDAYELSRNL
ncbi:MAG: NAD(P)/FAD-dependent oxidoreductase, partial [Thermoactinomyces sp.]